MQQREKLLLLGLGAALLIGTGLPVLQSFGEPIDEATEARDREESEVNKKDIEYFRVRRAENKIASWNVRALPADQQRAQALYQQWLTDLAGAVGGFKEVRVTPEAPKPSRERLKENGSGGKPIFHEIPIKITAKATMSQLRRFLFNFYRTDLLHEIENMRVQSPGTSGDPDLSVVITASGMSLPDANERGRTLFARTTLTNRVRSSNRTFRVASSDGFPNKTPFRARIRGEYFTVTAINGNEWTVARGVDLTRARSHRSETIIEFAPVAATPKLDPKSKALEQLVTESIFVKPEQPAPYRPSIDIAGEYVFPRGESLKLELSGDDVDRDRGPIRFELLGDTPPGLKLTPKDDKAEITWSPGSAPPSQATFKVKMTQGDPEEPAIFETEEEITVTYNTDPTIGEVAEQALSPGNEHKFVVKTDDADLPMDTVTLTASDLPEGATFDPATGEFVWTPSADMNDRTLAVKFTATDKLDASVTQTVSLKIGYDLAKVTILSSISLGFGPNGEPEASLLDTVNRKVLTLLPGGSFSYAGINGKVLAVDFNNDCVKVAVGEKIFELKLEGNLRDMKDITPKKPARPEPRTPLKAPRPAIAT